MAVYHLACRIALDGKQNPPARIAKYNGNCALASCDKSIHKGDTISCTRDNVNGSRRTAGSDTNAPDHRDPPDANEDPDTTENPHPCDRCGDKGSMRVTMSSGHTYCEDEIACADRMVTPDPSSAPEPKSTGNVAMRALAKELAPYLTIKAGVDASEVSRLVAEHGSRMVGGIVAQIRAEFAKPHTVEVKAPHVEAVDVGIQHKQFPLLVKALASGCNVWVTGPAGSGKTTAVHNAATALGKEYGYTGSCQDQYALTGYNDANGRYVRTPLRERYEHGGLFLWDEVDGSDPNALLAFNAMLANGTASFPDGMIKRHPDTLLAATANTFGLGGTHEYVGRNRLDAAFLDRFVFIDWQIDEALEAATCSNAAWVRRVQFIRSRVKAKGLKVLVTPRASYFGAKLLAQDIDQETVEAMVLRKGMSAEQWRTVDT